mmetsp:Transcript_91335/g.175839  ORF Transcript_91335/g.175839 Transcript_91335/m.175839 type:complete len:286 (+) Transcript_91335:137-994(+)
MLMLSDEKIHHIVELLPEAGVLAAMQVMLFGICLRASKRWWPTHPDQWTVADCLVSVALYPILTVAAFQGVFELRLTVESRWHARTFASTFFQTLYVTRCILHGGVLFMQHMSFVDLVLMVVHHVLSICCFSSALVTGNMHYWACLNGICETTNIFMNNVWLFKTVTYRNQRLQDYLPRTHAVNGVFLWLSYLVFRMLLFPYWIYTWHFDVTRSKAQTWDRVSPYERYFYPSVTVFLLLISFMWFTKITQGLCKVLSGLLAPPQNGGYLPLGENDPANANGMSEH